jgi:hypothetical protein
MCCQADPGPETHPDRTGSRTGQDRTAAEPAPSADGMCADSLARGWSPQAADILTLTWLQRIISTPLIGGFQ